MAAPPPILQLQDLHLTFGGRPALAGAELIVAPGDRIALVGRNGSGKSTLLRLAARLIEPDRGEVFHQPDATVRYLPQEPVFAGFADVSAYAEAGLGPGDDPWRVAMLLEALGLTGREDPAHLSGGEARRAALARVLAPEPDLLLLDEPTNHLDLPTLLWLEETLAGFRGAIVTISHDRRFLERVSRTTIWLDRGTTRRLDKGFAHFEAWRDQIFEEEERAAAKLARRIEREEGWLQTGVTARRKRNVGRLQRLQEMRAQREARQGITGTVKLVAADAETSSKTVIEAEGLSKAYGDQVVVKEFSTRILRGERVGLVGANGTGKTTLLNLLTGALKPDSGKIRIAKRLEMVTLDQKREALKPGWTLAQALSDDRGDMVMVGTTQRHVVGYMKDFLFTPDQRDTPISVLSGGERGRLMLARALARPSSLLVLDEPTNDLDLETLDLLQEMLADYEGTVLLVSHDRDFLDRTVTSVMIAEGDGTWQDYPGGYSDMERQRGKGVEAQPSPTRPGTSRPGAARASQPRGNAAQEPRPAPAEPPRRVKLSFKEKHALETLPATIEDMRRDIARLQERLGDPDFYGRDPKGFEAASADLARTEAELERAEELWLQLEIKREELEGS